MNAFTTKTGKPYFVFDDLHNEDQVSKTLQEFDLIVRPMMRRNDTGGTDLKNTNACFLPNVYSQFEVSPSFQTTRKYFEPDFVDKLEKHHWIFSGLSQFQLNENIQFIYYEKSDNYGAHYDIAAFTFLWWLAPEPIEGGDLILEEHHKINFRHNRVIIFPRMMKHEVLPVASSGRGRYCVSNFIEIVEGQ